MTSPPLEQLRAVSEYIGASRAALNDETAVSGLVTQQVESLKHAFSNGAAASVAEASSALKALSDSGDPVILAAFSADQRKALAASITSGCQPGAGCAQATNIGKAQNQEHFHMFNYLTRGDWDVLLNAQQMELKLRALIDRSMKIGLVNPSEKTVVALVSLLLVASRISAGPSESKSMIEDYKRANKIARRNGHFIRTFNKFPQLVEDFVLAHPAAYPEDDQPIPCPIQIQSIENRRHATAARKTHSSLQVDTFTTPTGSSSSSPSSANTQLMAALASFVMQQQQGQVPCPSLQILPPARGHPVSREPGQPANPPVLALQDGRVSPSASTIDHPSRVSAGGMTDSPSGASAGGATPVAPSPSSSAEGPNLDTMIAEMQQAVKQRKDAADEEEAEDEDDKGDSTPVVGTPKPGKSGKSGAGVTPCMKRPASSAGAAIKKPKVDTGAVIKKPKVEQVSTRNQIVARTGLPGEGSTKTFTYEKGKKDAAIKQATAWLRKACKEQGIEY